MTDAEIGEIYSLARDSFLGGQKEIQLQAYPFRMTPANMARHRNNPNFAFWRMIKQGYDDFEVSHLEPKVDVCDRHYVFDAVPPEGSKRPLIFHPTGRCPAYRLDPTIASAVMAKEQKDRAEFAELVRENAPVAPLETGTDGGMNRVFIARLDDPVYRYDNSGHLHVPPVQPGRLPPAISPPPGSESDMKAAIAEPPIKVESPMSNVFGNMFASGDQAAPTTTASMDGAAQKHSSFFGSLFSTGRHNDDTASVTVPVQAATAEPASLKLRPASQERPVHIARLRQRPKIELRTTEPAEARAAKHMPGTEAKTAQQKPKVEAVRQADALAPPASNSMINGAQPVVPGGSFNRRFEGLQ